MMWIAGVDGCRGGWCVVLASQGGDGLCCRTVAHFHEVFSLPENPQVIAADIPIGLLDASQKGGRLCDKQARALLGARRVSVFSPPVRAALGCRDYGSALRANRASSPAGVGLSRQSFGILPKIREVDNAITPALQERVFEVHPELCFYELNARACLRHPKKAPPGAQERIRLLSAAGVGNVTEFVEKHARPSVAGNDIVDACAALWTARRILRGEALRVPANPPCDSRGLRMEIWR